MQALLLVLCCRQAPFRGQCTETRPYAVVLRSCGVCWADDVALEKLSNHSVSRCRTRPFTGFGAWCAQEMATGLAV